MNDYRAYVECDYNSIYHYGVKGTKWGRRRFQNEDGSLTPEGERRYLVHDGRLKHDGKSNDTKEKIKETANNVKDTAKLMWKDKKKIAKDQIKGAVVPGVVGIGSSIAVHSLRRKGVREFLKDDELKNVRRGRDVYRHAKILSRRNKASLYDAKYIYKKYFKNEKDREKNISEIKDTLNKSKNFAKKHFGSKEAIKESVNTTKNFAKKHFGSKAAAKNTLSTSGKRALNLIKRNKKATTLIGASAAIAVGNAIAQKYFKAKGFGDNINMINNYYQEAKRENRKKKRKR